VREAECSCGQLRVTAEAEPLRVTVCHCLACQRRTGSAFSVNAAFNADNVQIAGRSVEYVRISDDGEERTYRFCPDCGATVYFTLVSRPDVIAVPVGAFADPSFPTPARSIYEQRRHAWLSLADSIESA
jgi:hypothetical protein